jgi:DNA-binding Lrp family transcriptional regulator
MLDVLRVDGRISMTELAERVGVSRANAYSRFERLRTDGVIEGFTARIDPRRLGLAVHALVTMQVEQHSWRRVRTELLAMDEVEYVAFTTGEFDVVILVRAADVEELRDVILVRLQAMAEVRGTRTILILDEVVPNRSLVL